MSKNPPSFKIRSTQIIGIAFICFVAASGVGIIVLTADYFTVYDTLNQFVPRVTRFTKSPDGVGDHRNLTLYLNLANPGSRMIYLFAQGGDPTQPTGIFFEIRLNNQYVASQEMLPALVLTPGSNYTLVVEFMVQGAENGYAQTIVEAELTGIWNWEIRYPMRVFIEWLYVREGHLRTLWSGIEEVPM